VVTAVHLLNRSPTLSLQGKTPYEAWYGRAPAVAHLRVFGCLCFAKELNQVCKLDDRSRPGVFLGYADGAKAYRVYDPVSRRVLISRDVIFDEAGGWDWNSSAEHAASMAEELSIDFELAAAGVLEDRDAPSPPPATTPTVSRPPALGEFGDAASPAGASTLPFPASTSRASPSSAPAHSPAPKTPVAAELVPAELATPLEDDEERLDAFYGDEPLRYRTVDNILGEESILEEVPRVCAQLHLTHAGEPTTHAEAHGDPAWRKAMETELESVEKNRTWELVDPPVGHRPITLKWVFKLKKDEKGAVIKHRARLVARGFVQQEGIDCEDAFAPVARMESVRVLLALAAQEGWRVHHMDVKSAFLNGDLKEEVYVRQPPGFAVPGEEGKVYHLRKALYGLRQAPRAWNAMLDATLKEMGFQQSAHEAAMYRRGGWRSVLLVGVYVDDLVIAGADAEEVEEFKAAMKQRFNMSDLGLLSFYLGIEVRQSASGISLSQAHYAKRILELSDMVGCNSVHTPM